MDYFFYSGPIERGNDLDFIQLVSMSKAHDSASLILCTGGGSPDAAYKIGRYMQQQYEHVSLFIPGMCKSAGTLLAIAAEELVFMPYGELGPLDIQMFKQDNLTSFESGLNISEAFSAVEARCRDTFHNMVAEIVSSSGGVISFATAARAATEVVGAMYGPVFAQVDPDEVGSRSRAMRIGESYGSRLNDKYGNLRENGIEFISRSYPSHGFVIDIDEAALLFESVREASDVEKLFVESLGNCCRFPTSELQIDCVTDEMAGIETERNRDDEADSKSTAKPSGERRWNGEDIRGASKSKRATPRKGSSEASPHPEHE